MKSCKHKSGRTLSALCIAATSAFLAGRSASAGVSLSMYYGDDSNYGNSNNSVLIGAGYNPASTNFDAQSETQYFGSETSVSITPGATARLKSFSILREAKRRPA